MSLTLISTGIAFDLTISAIEELKACDKAYWEGYTGIIDREKIAKLGQKLDKTLIQLKRDQVESNFLINEAKRAKICLLVSGDALTATTHISLLLEAKKVRVATKSIPNSSIYTAAAGKAGLQIYRFGKTVSLVNSRPNYNPGSAFEAIRENLVSNLHTLILLDTEPEPMDAKIALEMLEKAGFMRHKFVVLSRLGLKDEKINYGEIELLKEAQLGIVPFAIILPAKLHFLEKEYLANFKV